MAEGSTGSPAEGARTYAHRQIQPHACQSVGQKIKKARPRRGQNTGLAASSTGETALASAIREVQEGIAHSLEIEGARAFAFPIHDGTACTAPSSSPATQRTLIDTDEPHALVRSRYLPYGRNVGRRPQLGSRTMLAGQRFQAW